MVINGISERSSTGTFLQTFEGWANFSTYWGNNPSGVENNSITQSAQFHNQSVFTTGFFIVAGIIITGVLALAFALKQ